MGTQSLNLFETSPATKELLAAAPREMGRLHHRFCRMLAMEPPEMLWPPEPPNAAGRQAEAATAAQAAGEDGALADGADAAGAGADLLLPNRAGSAGYFISLNQQKSVRRAERAVIRFFF